MSRRVERTGAMYPKKAPINVRPVVRARASEIPELTLMEGAFVPR
jgi:hypothetical protein